MRHEIGQISVLEARDDYWGEGPYLDSLEFFDLGDDASAAIGAMASKQVHGIYEGDIVQLEAFEAMPHVSIYSANTAQTAVARGQVDQAPFDDPRIRKALRLAIDTPGHSGTGPPRSGCTGGTSSCLADPSRLFSAALHVARY